MPITFFGSFFPTLPKHCKPSLPSVCLSRLSCYNWYSPIMNLYNSFTNFLNWRLLCGGLQPCDHAAGFSSVTLRRMLWDSHDLCLLVGLQRHWPLLAPQSSFRLLGVRLLVNISMNLAAHTTPARQRSWPDTQLHASVWVAPSSETVSSFFGLGIRELVLAPHFETDDLVLGVDTASVTPCPSSCSPHYVSELCASLCLLPETTVIRIGASTPQFPCVLCPCERPLCDCTDHM